MDSGDSIPTTRYELIKFTEEIEKEYPGFKFDWNIINKMNTENLWFLEILSNQKVGKYLQDLIKEGNNNDCND